MPPGMRRLGGVHKGRAEKFLKIPDARIESSRREVGGVRQRGMTIRSARVALIAEMREHPG